MTHYYLLMGKAEVIEEAVRHQATKVIPGLVGMSLGSRDEAPCPNLIDAAVAAERERWAKVAEDTGEEMDDALAVNCGVEIARRIREGK